MKLVRANLFLMALIFKQSADAKLKFKFSLFNAKCRKADIADLEKLNLEAKIPVAALFPFAIGSLNEVPVVFRKLAERVSRTVEAEAHTTFFHGPISDWIKQFY